MCRDPIILAYRIAEFAGTLGKNPPTLDEILGETPQPSADEVRQRLRNLKRIQDA